MHSVFDTQRFVLKRQQNHIYLLSDPNIQYLNQGKDGIVYRFYKDNILKLLFPISKIPDLEEKNKHFLDLTGFDYYRFPTDLIADEKGNFAGTIEPYYDNNPKELSQMTADEFFNNLDGIQKETIRLYEMGIIPRDVSIQNILVQNGKMRIIDSSRFLLLEDNLNEQRMNTEYSFLIENLLDSIFVKLLKEKKIPYSAAALYSLDISEDQTLLNYFQTNFSSGKLQDFMEEECQKLHIMGIGEKKKWKKKI